MPQNKKYLHNLDIDRNALYNYKAHPITTAARIALGLTLTPADEGIQVTDTDQDILYWWDGYTWVTIGSSFGSSGTSGTTGTSGTSGTSAIVGALAYSATFNATTDWGSPSGGYYSITFNHNLGTAGLVVEVWDATGNLTQTLVHHIEQVDLLNLKISVPQIPDGRFAGTIVINGSAIDGTSGTSGTSGVDGSMGLSGTSGTSGAGGADPMNYVTVGLPGSIGVDFNSVKDAVDSIVGATASSPWTVKVYPGLYVEDTITMKSWISVKGESHTTTVIQASNVNNSVFVMADQSLVIDVQIQGSTGTGAAAVVYSSPTTPQTNAIAYIENVKFGANYTHAKTIGVPGGNCILQCSNVKYGGYPFTVGFHVTNSGGGIGRMQLRNVTSTNGGVVTTAGLIFALADQPGCTFIVNGCLLTKASGAAAGTGFWVENGASLRLTAVNFQRWATAIYAPNTGSAPSIFGSALNFENNTKDVVVQHPTATGHIEGTDTFLKTEIPIPAPLYEVNTDPRVITVGTKGADFTSIKAAVDWITGSSASNRFVVQVGPGQFFEDEIDLTGKPYVSIVGSNIQTTQIFPNSATQHLIRIGQNNEVSFLSLSDAPAGYAGIYCDDIGDFAQAHKVSFYNCDIGVWIKSSTQDTVFFGEYLDMNEVFTYGVKVEATNGFGATANLENYYLFPLGAGAVIGTYAAGVGAEIDIYTSSFAGEGATGSVCIQLEDGANLEASGLDIPNWDYAIQALNTGATCSFKIVGSMIHDSGTYDFDIQDVSCVGRFQGVSDHSKINNQSSNFYWNFLDDTDGENDITRKISVTFADGTHTDASTLIFRGSPMGLMEGGNITVVAGLQILVDAGYGYLHDSINPDVFRRIDWSNTTLTLTANSDNYIYFNDSSILSAAGSAPSSMQNIIVGRVVTNLTTVELIDVTPYQAEHMSNKLSTFNREALGSVFASGSTVAENVTPFRLDVGSGNYYFSENNFLPSGGTAITFSQYYRDGGTGWTVSTTNTVNNTQYDDGTGTLASLTALYYTKHALYLVGDGANEKYFLVLGQAEYSSLVVAEGAALPLPPSYFTDGVVPIAAIYIQQGDTNIVQIEDIRPVIGFKASGVSAASVHGNLLGLGADDHTQYLLVDGTRQMTGDLGLGGNDIFNVNDITAAGLTDTDTLKISSIPNDEAQTRFVVVDSAGNTYYKVTGVGGTSGTSGSSGLSGSSGSSGTSGQDGSSGTSGVNGTSGSSGTSGVSGSSGTSGVSGSSGTSGNSGSSGTSGNSGSSGTSGSTGTSGTSGVNGSSGTSGSSGSTGTSGTSGLNGSSGTSGINGSSGSSGTSGQSGSSGTSGSSGSSGTSGVNGSSGTSGNSGSSGTSGINGSSGTSGNSGSSGTSGNSGSSGTSGQNGSSGTAGTSGINGSSGTSGNSGSSGTSGSTGTSGTSGITGSSGTSGVNGSSGSSGTSGVNGSSGTSGTTGSSGTSGQTGSSGTSGANGSSGTSGQNGSSGTSGNSGSSGTSGVTGSSGTSGITGSSGTSGTSGLNGSSGTSGVNGSSGTSGNSGSSGTSGNSGSSGTSGGTGSSGTSGVNGSSGTSGNTGSSGTSGTTGTSGTSGNTGSSGTSGNNGSSGTSGTSGNTGSSGTSGNTGSSGTSGNTGSSGTSGETGSSGTSGNNGSSGTSGNTGSSGTSGDTGSSGTSGNTGSSGTSGNNGSSGTSGDSGSSGTSGADGLGSSGTSGASGTSGTSGVSSSPTIVTLAANQNNSTTTGTEVTGLTTTLGVGTYWIQVMIRYQSAATTTGVKFGVNHSGTSTLMATMRWSTTGTTATSNAPSQNVTGGEILEANATRAKSTTAPNLGPSLSVDLQNADMMCVIDVYLNVTASGDFELWHGSEVAAQSTVMAGSALIIYQVA